MVLGDKLKKSQTFKEKKKKKIKYVCNDPDFCLYHLASFHLGLVHCS